MAAAGRGLNAEVCGDQSEVELPAGQVRLGGERERRGTVLGTLAVEWVPAPVLDYGRGRSAGGDSSGDGMGCGMGYLLGSGSTPNHRCRPRQPSRARLHHGTPVGEVTTACRPRVRTNPHDGLPASVRWATMRLPAVRQGREIDRVPRFTCQVSGTNDWPTVLLGWDGIGGGSPMSISMLGRFSAATIAKMVVRRGFTSPRSIPPRPPVDIPALSARSSRLIPTPLRSARIRWPTRCCTSACLSLIAVYRDHRGWTGIN